MSNIAIRAEGISKQFRIGGPAQRYRTFREAATQSFTSPFRRVAGLLRGNSSAAANLSAEMWALRDVSFEVKTGEVVGIVGRNGAGKSTLLKILSLITEPTEGYAEIFGRVGALLEVGTGFHSELTGRENIFLNAAILGMTRAEIRRKFDEIVAFAEVEQFIDTPVKHYSSGMALRLGFAVAAHLEPEILVVDEVLAVGDIAFQQKCLGKMHSVATEGRTVLFVSHNLAAVKELCETAIVLEKGQVRFRGGVAEGLAVYTQQILPTVQDPEDMTRGWQIILGEGQENGIVRVEPGEPVRINARFRADESIKRGNFFCIVISPAGEMVVHQMLESKEIFGGLIEPNLYRITVDLPPLWLTPGVYSLFFKFIETQTGIRNRRYLSENVLLNIHSTNYGSSLQSATHAPPLSWNAVPEETISVAT